jgi:uncharacterized protein (DUF1697 family)
MAISTLLFLAEREGQKMPTQRYLVLLRAINVGGNAVIKMADLKASFESMGFKNVSTYIQSGNVCFDSAENAKSLVQDIEKTLSKRFSYASQVVILSFAELENVIKKAPKGFGQKPDVFRSDVMFLKPPLKASDVVSQLPLQDGVDAAYAGPGVVYFTRRSNESAQSQLPKIIKLAVYKQLTIRNWNTTTALLDRMKSNG